MTEMPKQRLFFLDHLRAFIIVLVLVQHAAQTYGQFWGRLYFAYVPERSDLFDALFMWTDSFIMQVLFFVAGIFILTSLQKRGLGGFVWEKIKRLVIPYGFGVAFLVAPLVYAKLLMKEGSDVGYLDFWFNTFFAERFQGGGYWFLIVLALFSLIAALLQQFLPVIINFFGAIVRGLNRRPIVGWLSLCLLCSLLIGISDLMWGMPWWIGFGKVFVGRANMYGTFILFFILGLGLRASGLMAKTDIFEKLANNWALITLGTGVLSLAYVGYSVGYMYEGAVSDEIRYFFHAGGVWGDEAWALIWEEAPGVLIRTTLHGFLVVTVTYMFLAIFYRFVNHQKPLWVSLSACSYGIYFVHEPIVVWVQYGMDESAFPLLFKFLIGFILSLLGSWAITDKVLRRLPLTRNVF